MDKKNAEEYIYNIGEIVVYRNSGIYRINDIRKENFCDFGVRIYYVMRSVYDKSSIIYVPVDTKDIDAKIRNVLSPEELEDTFCQVENSENIWKDDVKERAEYFEGLLDSGESSDLLWLYNALISYKCEIENIRRKLYASDAKILAATEKIITDEFSYVLGIDKSDVIPYITDKIENMQNKSTS